MKNRRGTRFAVQLPVSFRGERAAGEGIVLNLSAMGCAITAADPAAPGDYLQLDIQLRDTEEPLHVEVAAARWVAGSRFGLEFIRFRRTDSERLRLFVEMLEPTARS